MRPIVKLGEAVDFSQGIQVPIEDQSMVEKSGLVRFLRIVDFTQGNQEPRYVGNFGDRYFVKKDDISMVRYGTPGFVCSGLEGIIANNLFKITPKHNDIYKKYLYFYFKSPYFLNYLDRESSGVAMKAINFGSLKNIQIPLPPLETQKAIVAKLDQIFSELDQTKSEIQKNLDNTDELWKSALNQAFQGDWEMKKLGKMAEIGDGLHGTPQYEQLSEYRFINGNNIKGGHINFNSAKYISENTYNKLKIDFTVGRTVFISINGTIGNLAFYNNEKIALGKSVCYFNIKYSGLSTEYLFYYLQTNTSKNYYDNNKTGNTIMNLGLKAIREYSIPVPPLSEQEKIVEHLDQVSKEVKALKSQYQSQLDNLEELKKSVLDKAFRGEMG